MTNESLELKWKQDSFEWIKTVTIHQENKISTQSAMLFGYRAACKSRHNEQVERSKEAIEALTSLERDFFVSLTVTGRSRMEIIRKALGEIE